MNPKEGSRALGKTRAWDGAIDMPNLKLKGVRSISPKLRWEIILKEFSSKGKKIAKKANPSFPHTL